MRLARRQPGAREPQAASPLGACFGRREGEGGGEGEDVGWKEKERRKGKERESKREEQVWVVGFWLLRRILVRLTTICHDFAQFRIMVSHQATPKEEREKTKEERAIADVSLLL